MDNLADRVFDAFGKFSEHVHKLDKIRRIAAQIRDVKSETCGNCNHWIKTRECPRERRGEKPSMNDPGCDEFTYCSNSKMLIKKFESDLIEAQKK